MNKKRIAVLLLALTLATGVAKPQETQASPQQIIEASYEMAPSLGPWGTVIIIGGTLLAGGVAIYEMVKIPHLPDTGTPNSRAIKIHPKTNEPIQYRYYDENGKTRLDIDLTDHGKPEYHPYVPHKHTYKNGERQAGEPLTSIEKEFYLGWEE